MMFRIARSLKKEINRNIIKFFLENPSSIDTARGIATWINEDPEKTGKALEELTKAKILTAHGAGAASAYGYTTDARVIRAVIARMARWGRHKKQ